MTRQWPGPGEGGVEVAPACSLPTRQHGERCLCLPALPSPAGSPQPRPLTSRLLSRPGIPVSWPQCPPGPPGRGGPSLGTSSDGARTRRVNPLCYLAF